MRTASTTHSGSPSTSPEQPGEVDIRRFKLNHPKNYLAVPLAEAADAGTEFLIREYAVNLPKRARRGAMEAELITTDGDLTSLGEAAVVNAVRHHGSPRKALEDFATIHGSPKRFIDAFPNWEGTAKRLAFKYDATEPIVGFLREQGSLCLDELTWLLWKYKPALAESVFLHPDITSDLEISRDTRPPSKQLTDSTIYRSECTFQFKAFLFHCGILESRGDYSSRLEPTTDEWTLCPSTE